MSVLLARLALHRRPGLGFVIGWLLALGLSILGVVSVNGFWPPFIWILTTLLWAALFAAARVLVGTQASPLARGPGAMSVPPLQAGDCVLTPRGRRVTVVSVERGLVTVTYGPRPWRPNSVFNASDLRCV